MNDGVTILAPNSGAAGLAYAVFCSRDSAPSLLPPGAESLLSTVARLRSGRRDVGTFNHRLLDV